MHSQTQQNFPALTPEVGCRLYLRAMRTIEYLHACSCTLAQEHKPAQSSKQFKAMQKPCKRERS